VGPVIVDNTGDSLIDADGDLDKKLPKTKRTIIDSEE